MHSEGNYKQGEKAAFRMGENNRKCKNWQTINLQNIKEVHAAQYWTAPSKSGPKI